MIFESFDLIRSPRLRSARPDKRWGSQAPAFLVEECGETTCAIFVPSVFTPAAGAIYIIAKSRVHPVDVPFRQAVAVISKWGEGSRVLYLAMKRAEPVRQPA